jgi:hypothetical protein
MLLAEVLESTQTLEMTQLKQNQFLIHQNCQTLARFIFVISCEISDYYYFIQY